MPLHDTDAWRYVCDRTRMTRIRRIYADKVGRIRGAVRVGTGYKPVRTGRNAFPAIGFVFNALVFSERRPRYSKRPQRIPVCTDRFVTCPTLHGAPNLHPPPASFSKVLQYPYKWAKITS